MNYKNMGKVVTCAAIAACVCGGNAWGTQSQGVEYKTDAEVRRNPKCAYLLDGNNRIIGTYQVKKPKVVDCHLTGSLTVKVVDTDDIFEEIPDLSNVEFIKDGKSVHNAFRFKVKKFSKALNVKVKASDLSIKNANDKEVSAIKLAFAFFSDQNCMNAVKTAKDGAEPAKIYSGHDETGLRLSAAQQFWMKICVSTNERNQKYQDFLGTDKDLVRMGFVDNNGGNSLKADCTLTFDLESFE